MNAVSRCASRIAGAIALTVTATCLSAPAAKAEPATSPAIGWNQVGLSDRIDVVGANQPTAATVPVPQGATPRLLIGQMGSMINVGGRVDVFDARGILLGSIAIPTDVATIPFTVDVSRADVTAGASALSFVIRDSSQPASSCAEAPSVTLSQLATTYSGPTPNPWSVADFLPGYLDQITIQIGDEPTRDQQQAALALVARLTHLYRPIPVRIDVDTSATPMPADVSGLRRVVSIRDSDQAGFVVENPDSPAAVLVISGRGPALLRQVELFADRRFELAQSVSAAVTSAEQTVPLSTRSLTFGEMGISAQASVLGSSTVYLGFDAAAFAVGQIDHARINLRARYTPVTSADASVTLRSGDVVVASHVLDESGVLNMSGDIPAGPISSNVGLALEIRYIPSGECAPVYDRMTFSVDPRSTVAVTPGTNNRGGFPVLPMAFTPEFDVAIENPAQIGHAAQAINLMGQQSTIALRPNVATLDDAAKRGSGLLVVATGQELVRAGMNPPLLSDAGDVDVNGNPVTGIDVNGPVGVIEAFSHNDRMVLAIQASGDGLAEQSFDHIRGLDARWASLTGDVVATGAAGITVALTLREGGTMTSPVVGDAWKWWVWVTIGLGISAIFAVALVLIVRQRRTKA